MEQILSLITQYGAAIYVLLFVYCAMKSGSLPLFAGYAAQTGALDLSIVTMVVFAGGVMGDEIRFFVARKYGEQLFAKRPRFAHMLKTAKFLFARYGITYLFLYRYPKGMRTIGAFPVGLTAMPWPQFSGMNFASAGLWTMIMVGSGYLFGKAIGDAVSEGWGILAVVLLIVFLAAFALLWRQASRMVLADVDQPKNMS